MFKRTFMKNMKLINEEINKIRKMMGLNEGWDNDDYVDDISSAKSSAKRQYDFYQDAIEYVGKIWSVILIVVEVWVKI
jgi:hypothetical protein